MSSENNRRLLVREVLHDDVATIASSASLSDAAARFADTAAADLAVLDEDDRFVGVLSEGDLLRAVMPKFDELVAQGGSVAAAFDAFIANGSHLHDQPISRLVIGDAITLGPDDELLSAATVMVSKQIRRLPVVDDGKLLGTVSRADLCRQILGDIG